MPIWARMCSPGSKWGVGEKPKGYDLADYVLGHFSGEDREIMRESYRKAADAVEMILEGDLSGAMNTYKQESGA